MLNGVSGSGGGATRRKPCESSADTSGLSLLGRPWSSSLSDSVRSAMVSPASESSAGSSGGGVGAQGSSLSKVGRRYQERGQSMAM